MFAIALYDKKIETLFLVRDRIGKKPLYYWKDGSNLVFASELKPIMEYPGFPKNIRKDVIKRYLFQQCINDKQQESLLYHTEIEKDTLLVLREVLGNCKFPHCRQLPIYHHKNE